MSDKKQVFLSLETARKMYKDSKGNKSLHLFLLENFTKEELEAKELPKEFNKLKYINGYKVTTDCRISELVQTNHALYDERNLFPTKELAEASLALSQLLQLRDVYNGNWKVNLNNKSDDIRYIIYNRNNNIELYDIKDTLNYLLSFQKKSIRDEFVKNFKDLITQALPLL